MRRNSIVILVVCLLVPAVAFISFFGISITRDVDPRSPLWGDYHLGQELRLNFAVFIVEDSSSWVSDNWALSPAGDVKLPYRRHYMTPKSLAAYRRDGRFSDEVRSGYADIPIGPPDIKGIAEIGTVIEVSELKRSDGWGGLFLAPGKWFTVLTVFGEIRNGPHAGTRVDMQDVSTITRYGEDGLFLYSPYDLAFDPMYFPDGKITAELCAAERHLYEPIFDCPPASAN
jgi:hypothetical protein